MARLIPPYLSADCLSPGERALFERFRDEDGTAGWTVFHSLGIARHPSRLAGEVDFLIVVPGHGVLCLEVKAGQVRREGGVWIYGAGPREETSTVGPFRQAADGMHAMRRHVARTDPSLRHLLFASGVIFTGIAFDQTSPEWFGWQVVDRAALSQHTLAECCLLLLAKAHEHTAVVHSARWYDPRRSRPDPNTVERLLRVVRGDFECVVSPRQWWSQTEHQIAAFTDEQCGALDALEENPRLLFKGPAGTGKTLLALEAARRAALRGRRTLLCCFNWLLGHWLEEQAARYVPSTGGVLEVGTLHSQMLRVSPLECRPDHAFWSVDLPRAFVEKARRAPGDVASFDTIIVDEAQDVIRPRYLDALDVVLRGGLASGRWVMFGDLENQAIYWGNHDEEPHALLRDRSPEHFVFPLRVNCRNTAQIASGVEIACGLDPGYSRLLRGEAGPDIETAFFATRLEQESLLRQCVKKSLTHFMPREIVVLSAKEDGASCAGRLLRHDSAPGLGPLRAARCTADQVGFATIHAFRGLEAPVVVLTDVDSVSRDDAVALLYVGMSRARFQLIILLPEELRNPWMSKIQAGFLRRAAKGSRV